VFNTIHCFGPKYYTQDVLRFCHDHNLVLLADEVYQENVYGDNCEFVSCKKAAAELGYLDNDAIELASFHSSSKGLFGECGRRGGYMVRRRRPEKVTQTRGIAYIFRTIYCLSNHRNL